MYGPVIRRIALPAGEKIPVPGQGTWHMGEVREKREAEIGPLRLGLALGLTLIDAAEMYAGGDTERLVGDAIMICCRVPRTGSGVSTADQGPSPGDLLNQSSCSSRPRRIASLRRFAPSFE
jgi:hypothetical protein